MKTFCFLLLMALSLPALSLPAFSGADTLFPGPAQSPAGMNTTVFAFKADTGVVEWFGRDKVKIGFERYVYPPPWEKNTFCSDGFKTFACTHAPNYRAANIGLELLTSKEFGSATGSCQWGKKCTLTSSNNKFSSYTVYGATLTLEPGIYYFGSFRLNNGAKLVVNGEVEIHVNQFSAGGDNDVNASGQPRNLVFYHHNQEFEKNYVFNEAPTVSVEDMFTFNTPADIKAYVYSSGVVQIPWDGTLFGSVTARQIFMQGNAKIVYSGELYGEQLDISPISYSASACERIPLTFSVKDSNGNLNRNANGLLDVFVTSENKDICWTKPDDATETCHAISLREVEVKNGVANLLLSGWGGSIDIVGFYDPTSSSAKSLMGSAGPFSFSPSGYLVNEGRPVELIAGKTNTVNIKVVTSIGGGQCETEEGIDGKFYFNTKTNFESPNSGMRKAVLNGVETGDGNNLTEIKFKKGVGEIDIDYLDAGHISVDLEVALSPSAEIIEHIDNQRKPLPETPPEKARATIYARPYTLAICEAGSSLPDDSEIGSDNKFIKAGESFSLALKPIIWSKEHMIGPKKGGASVIQWRLEHCDSDWASTPNFWKGGAPSASVALNPTAKISAPAGGDDVSIGDLSKPHTDAVNGRYAFNDIVVNDVGSYKFHSELLSTYLGMEVTPSEREIGRFYPSHFGLSAKISPGIEPAYDAESKGFTYLEQPFSGNYVINAMTTDNKPVKNYHLFSGANDKAAFEDWALHNTTDLTSRWEHPALPSQAAQQWKAGAGRASEVAIDGSMMMQKSALPDGPFESLRFAVGVKSPDRDGTGFTFCDENVGAQCVENVPNPKGGSDGAKFGKGDFFFGRMRIEGFAETQDLTNEQTQPVAVEVFNGTHFVTNTRDNATIVSTDIGKKDVLFSDNAALQAKIELRDDAKNVVATKNVKEGRADFHVIAPDQSSGLNREQFRYWQQLDKAVSGVVPQTWLQHNWQGTQFDDDPSAIGTFGFYRGSDRVIYKGEKNITLTGE
ncbi:hypothetical protein A1OO_02200 [Enterovibrio norvegicus FF-33]|uniref:DUF6701 domain-containing protein n=1 Tax=Enterovibrio norvegicus TaxID=188144 RepID=UPI0002E883FA|nr:DUF6701 domain-containing protein [Enterovibrio norvegicus]OEE70609.1 hypothetical protein A1OO_02200 [Enterovibrio norvegicus FF-33]